MIGKSRLGGRKLNVRIDGGELEIGLCHYASSLLYPDTRDLLDVLITQDEIIHFYRPSEKRWINIRLDPVRGRAGCHQGPERRRTDDKPKSEEQKAFVNTGRYCPNWLERLCRDIESS